MALQLSVKSGPSGGAAVQVRDVVLVHVIPQLLKFDDLKTMPSDEWAASLLDGQKVRPSLAGAVSGSNAGEPGSGSIGLIKSDLNACAPNSIIHTCLLYTSPSPRDRTRSRMPSSA